MKIRIWGCRGSIPRPNPEMAGYGGNTPCIEVVSCGDGGGHDDNDVDGHRIILDLGSGAYDLGQKILGEMFQKKKKLQAMEEEHSEREDGEGQVVCSTSPANGSSVKKPSKFGGSILITHTHWDHIQGLPFFVPLYLPQFEWTIYGPRGVAKSLQETLSGQMQHDYFPVRLGDMGSGTTYVGLSEDTKQGFWLGEEEACTSVQVTSKYLNHSVLTLGYKLEEFAQIFQSDHGSKRAKKGVSMAYITDHEPFDHALAKGGFVASNINAANNPGHHISADHSHAQFFKDVDVLLHDAQYLYSEYSPDSPSPKEYWGHSTVEYVIEVAFYANVKQLLLFHHDPQRNDDQMDDLVKFARKKAEELETLYGDSMASDGKRIPMKVDAAREGDEFELDPFIFIEGDDVDVDLDDGNNVPDLAISSQYEASVCNESDKRPVLLGFYRTEAAPIVDVLQSSCENTLEVKVLQNSNDILQYAQEEQPSVIVLDENLFGRSGFEVCEEIRSNMGAWGRNVSLMVIASPKGNGSHDEVSDSTETKEEQADRLYLEDYIQGPFSTSYLLTRIQVSLLRMPLRWRRAPFTSNESERLLTLQDTGLLDSLPEERFERITRLCAHTFGVPISLVSLVDKDRQWFKANTGLPGATQTPRDHAFCTHAILEDDGVMVVPDALQDSRFADNPLVEGGPKIRFYAGCPIKVPSSDGNGEMPLGTLCIISDKPRDLGEDELQALKDFGAMVEHEINGQ